MHLIPPLGKPVYSVAIYLTTLFYITLPANAQESPENTRIFKSLIENKESVLGEQGSFFNKEIDHIAIVNPFLLSAYLDFFNSNFRVPDVEKQKNIRRLIRAADNSYNVRIDLEIERLKKDTTISGALVNYAAEVLQSFKAAESKRTVVSEDSAKTDPIDFFPVYLCLKRETGLVRNPTVNYEKLVDSLASIRVIRAQEVFTNALKLGTVGNNRLESTWRSSWFWLKVKGADPGDSEFALYKLILASKREKPNLVGDRLIKKISGIDFFNFSITIRFSGGGGYFKGLNSLTIDGPTGGMVNAPQYRHSYQVPNFFGFLESTFSLYKDPIPFSEYSVGFWGSSASGTFSDPSEQVFSYSIPQELNFVDYYKVTFFPENTSWKSRFGGIYFLTNLWSHPYFKLEAGIHIGEQSLVFSGDLPYRGEIIRMNTQTGYTYTRLDSHFSGKISNNRKVDLTGAAARLKLQPVRFSELTLTWIPGVYMVSAGLWYSFSFD